MQLRQTTRSAHLKCCDLNHGLLRGVAWGDYNNDGSPDLYVSVMNGKNHLFRNDGPRDARDIRKGWRFTDVTAEAGVVKHRNSFATWFFDYDNAGWPDLFVAGYSLESSADIGAFEMGLPVLAEKPKLYRNMHDGTFRDVTSEVHLDRAILTMGANFGDLDNDGWLDVYLGTGDSTYEALLPNRMFRNDGGHRFEDVTTAGDFGHLQKGHSVAFADLRRTGEEDVFEEMGEAQPGESFQSALYNNGDGTFTDVSERGDVGHDWNVWPVGYVADLDNDGWPDIYVANDSSAATYYQNQKDGTFKDVAIEAGIAYSPDGKLQAGMGVAVGDFNRDGLLDIVKTNFAGDTGAAFNEDGREQAGMGPTAGDYDGDGHLDLFKTNF
jgi:hypothetical protein